MAIAAYKLQELPDASTEAAQPMSDTVHLAGSPLDGQQDRWSGRKTLAFTLVVCGGSWAGIILGLRALLA
jgi:hypothetical protein